MRHRRLLVASYHRLQLLQQKIYTGRAKPLDHINGYYNSLISCRRSFASSGWTGVRGHDITGESLTWGDRPKVILLSYSPTGIDVQNTVKKVVNVDDGGDDWSEPSDGSVHMHGSVLAFPYGCFLWNVASVQDVTVESIVAPIQLHRPKLDYLFIGCSGEARIPLDILAAIQKELQPIVVEQMALSNAMGTFNILNAEDRQAAVALVLDPREIGDEQD